LPCTDVCGRFEDFRLFILQTLSANPCSARALRDYWRDLVEKLPWCLLSPQIGHQSPRFWGFLEPDL
jgi:hypothetical protein